MRSYSISVDATSWIYTSEIFPTPVRAKGMSVSISGLFVATIIYLQAAPTAFANIGYHYYIVFIVVTGIMVPVTWFFFPEVRFTVPTKPAFSFPPSSATDICVDPDEQAVS